jgi:hypothetical protein
MKKQVQKALLTLFEEAVGRGTSREVLVAPAFFRRLEARTEVLFLGGTSGDLTTTASSREGSLVIVKVSKRGEAVASLFGSSSSLKREKLGINKKKKN